MEFGFQEGNEIRSSRAIKMEMRMACDMICWRAYIILLSCHHMQTEAHAPHYVSSRRAFSLAKMPRWLTYRDRGLNWGGCWKVITTTSASSTCHCRRREKESIYSSKFRLTHRMWTKKHSWITPPILFCQKLCNYNLACVSHYIISTEDHKTNDHFPERPVLQKVFFFF